MRKLRSTATARCRESSTAVLARSSHDLKLKGRNELRGHSGNAGLFERVLSAGGTSPTGLARQWNARSPEGLRPEGRGIDSYFGG